ncbi:hypothetical protein [Pantoea agglomerans]|uniref:hypothetical protein n=1 Tax=Enterobacter agglomerans TaxID=549 RepID=UPI003159F1C0
MINKVWKVFKEVAIGILLVLSLWLVVNGALKESKGHFEFGNLMDFFNTLGTLGTLYVAYLVYKNAPKWLHQKIDEQGLEIANKLFTQNILEINTKFFTLHSCFKIFIHNYNNVNTTGAYDNLKVDLGSTKIDIISLQNIRYQTSANYVSAKKLGWVFHEEIKTSFDHLLKRTDLYIIVLKSVNRRLKKYEEELIKTESTDQELIERRLLSVVKFLEKYEKFNFERFQKSYDEFINIAETVPEYFKKLGLK